GEVGIQEKRAVPALKDFAPRFMETIANQCADKPATVSFYSSKLKRLLECESLAAARLDEVEEEAVENYKQLRSKSVSRRHRFLAPASVNRELATLRRLLRLAHEWKILDRVPRIRLMGGEQNREFVLTPTQEKLYLKSASTDIRDLAI